MTGRLFFQMPYQKTACERLELEGQICFFAGFQHQQLRKIYKKDS